MQNNQKHTRECYIVSLSSLIYVTFAMRYIYLLDNERCIVLLLCPWLFIFDKPECEHDYCNIFVTGRKRIYKHDDCNMFLSNSFFIWNRSLTVPWPLLLMLTLNSAIWPFLNVFQAVKDGLARVYLFQTPREAGRRPVTDILIDKCDVTRPSDPKQKLKVTVTGVGANLFREELEAQLNVEWV